MGLGKTLTMISLVLRCKEEGLDTKKSDDKIRGGTLVVCPVTLLEQWEQEVKRRCKRDLLDVNIYHGPKRQIKSKK